MFCSNCGEQIKESGAFCSNCGFKITSNVEHKPNSSTNTEIITQGSIVNTNANIVQNSSESIVAKMIEVSPEEYVALQNVSYKAVRLGAFVGFVIGIFNWFYVGKPGAMILLALFGALIGLFIRRLVFPSKITKVNENQYVLPIKVDVSYLYKYFINNLKDVKIKTIEIKDSVIEVHTSRFFYSIILEESNYRIIVDATYLKAVFQNLLYMDNISKYINMLKEAQIIIPIIKRTMASAVSSYKPTLTIPIENCTKPCSSELKKEELQFVGK